MRRWATISADGRYRYSLGREWGKGPRAVFVMLNPSTADAEEDDTTIRKCIGFAERWGFASIHVVNLFAWRATHPRVLRLIADPVGPLNDIAILAAVKDPPATVVAAWGRNGMYHPTRVAEVERLLGSRDVRCLDVTKDGEPLHPLMASYALVPQRWQRGAAPPNKEK